MWFDSAKIELITLYVFDVIARNEAIYRTSLTFGLLRRSSSQ